MSSDPYSLQVRELFGTTAHAGVLDDGCRVRIDDQGVRIELSAQIDGSRIETLRFRAWGCPHTIAAAEAVCQRFEGAGAADLDAFDVADLMQTLAVPAEKSGRILALEDAIRSLGSAVRES